MIVSTSHKFKFFHVPKCAGTAMKEVLLPISMTETFYKYYVKRIKENKNFKQGSRGKGYWSDSHGQHSRADAAVAIFPEYYSWAFVRNPFDRVVSAWLKEVKEMKYDKSFESFVEEGMGLPATALQMTDYLYSSNKNLMNFIGRYENIQEDWKKVTNELGFSVNLPHLNQSKPHNYKDYYKSEELKKLVEAKFEDDFNNFSYTF